MDTSTNLETMPDINELDDLGDLFEFGDIDLNNITDPVQFGDRLSQKHDTTHPNTPFLDMSEPPPMPGTSAHDFGGSEQFILPQGVDDHSFVQQHDVLAPASTTFAADGIYQPSMLQSYNPYPTNLNFQPQPGFQSNQAIPPTPNSYEMYGETGRFLQQQQQPQSHLDAQQRAFFEQRYQVRKDDAIAFTPMVSPAGTPQYNIIPEFTTPGAYFSPLTSPMLQAQLQQQGYLTNPSTAASSTTNSPIHPNRDVEMLDGLSLPESARQASRKPRRKPTTQRSVSGAAKVKQSPSQAAQKRKSALVNEADVLLPQATTSQPASAGTSIPSHFDSSEADSVSPEHSSEAIMGPPPRPGSSLTQSPALKAQQQQNAGPAATPKSLLTMRGAQQPTTPRQTPIQNMSSSTNDSGNLDILALPEAARAQNGRHPALAQIDTQLASTEAADQAPRSSARKTPKLDALSTPASTRSSSVLPSPSIAGSPMAVSTPAGILKDKKDARSGGRTSKKRGSMSTSTPSLVSPALVPRISPSIKPLLPEGTPLNTATQAMLLASKSNYQNLVEGNHLPGVTYPDSLSTGLTSKRTSHKVAEQGRRNRINEALKEMQNLIPKSAKSSLRDSESAADTDGTSAEISIGDGEGSATNADGLASSSKDDAAAKNSNSKAATVELANEYIKKMQKESAVQNEEMLQLKKEVDDLRKRLAEHRRQADGEEMTDESSTASPVSSPPVDVKT